MKVFASTVHETHFISCLLQNSILELSNIKFELSIKLDRFCWEHYKENNEPSRVPALLRFIGVTKVLISNPLKKDYFLELLSIQCHKDNYIKLIFHNKTEIKIFNSKFKVILSDLAESRYSNIIPTNHINY